VTYHGGVVIAILIVLEWVALLQIQEVMGSDPGLETGYSGLCCEFPQSLQVKCQTPPQISPYSFKFIIH
jgi:hypothetical protein